MILVTVRLDPPRYDRGKRLVQRFQTTGQSIIQTALDRSMVTPEHERTRRPQIDWQSMLFALPQPEEENPPRPKQDSFALCSRHRPSP